MIATNEREELMVRAYGEVCKRAEAARILDRNVQTINAMISDGRLSDACEGTRVDVRSIARYIAAPAQHEEEGRIARIKRRNGCEWAVG